MKNTGQVFLSLTALQAPAQPRVLSPDSQQDLTLLPVHSKRGRSPSRAASEPTVKVCLMSYELSGTVKCFGGSAPAQSSPALLLQLFESLGF